MYRQPVRNLHSTKSVPTRVCDVAVLDEMRILLEFKTEKGKVEQIPWEDVVYQVEVAREKYKMQQRRKLP